MPTQKLEYQCPRCKYQTKYKSHMEKHFYKTIKPCPGSFHDIELTEEIKQKVLRNRIYEVKSSQTHGQIVNNFNCLQSMVSSLDSYDKLSSIVKYDRSKIVNYGDLVEQINSGRIEKFDSKSSYNLTLTHDDLTDSIEKSLIVRNKEELSQMSIIYLQKSDKLAIYHDDGWDEYRFEKGVKMLMEIHQRYYFESYEKYLIHKIYEETNLDAYTRNTFVVQLNDYYKYLAIFNLKPYTFGKTNDEIVDRGPYRDLDNSFYLYEHTKKLYDEEKENLTKAEIRKAERNIDNLIKKSTVSNIECLNKAILQLINADQEFKRLTMEKAGMIQK